MTSHANIKYAQWLLGIFTLQWLLPVFLGLAIQGVKLSQRHYIEQHEAHEKVFKTLRLSYKDMPFVVVVDGKEFIYKGSFYDVKSVKLDRNTLVFEVIEDEHETHLQKELTALNKTKHTGTHCSKAVKDITGTVAVLPPTLQLFLPIVSSHLPNTSCRVYIMPAPSLDSTAPPPDRVALA